MKTEVQFVILSTNEKSNRVKVGKLQENWFSARVGSKHDSHNTVGAYFQLRIILLPELTNFSMRVLILPRFLCQKDLVMMG